MNQPRTVTKSAKAAVMRREFRSRVVRDRTKYTRKRKHKHAS